VEVTEVRGCALAKLKAMISVADATMTSDTFMALVPSMQRKYPDDYSEVWSRCVDREESDSGSADTGAAVTHGFC